jgi:hypothetical protein
MFSFEGDFTSNEIIPGEVGAWHSKPNDSLSPLSSEFSLLLNSEVSTVAVIARWPLFLHGDFSASV